MNAEIKERIILLTKLCTLEMRVEKDGIISLWRWDYKQDKLIRVK